MLDTDKLAELLQPCSSALEADGYEMRVAVRSEVIDVVVAASDQACADCLVPKPVLASMIERMLAATPEAAGATIQLTYPADVA